MSADFFFQNKLFEKNSSRNTMEVSNSLGSRSGPTLCQMLNPYNAIIFCPENVCCIYSNTLQKTLNTMNLDQTVPTGAVLSGSILFSI